MAMIQFISNGIIIAYRTPRTFDESIPRSGDIVQINEREWRVKNVVFNYGVSTDFATAPSDLGGGLMIVISMTEE